jgi:cbb3-type cytochrome oxidase cytochrome c subunit
MTQTEEIRDHLESGRTLNPLQALKSYGCFRLAARILDLRETGLDVHMKMIQDNDKRYAEYSL